MVKNHILNSTTQKRVEGEENGSKDRKALCKSMNNAIYGKTIENVKDRTDVRLVNKKEYLKCISKPRWMSHKIFDNNLVPMRKSKVALKRSKPPYTGVCILELSKICKNSIMVTLKINMTTNLLLSYCLLTLTI